MWDKFMIVATVSALVGVLLAWVSMLQAPGLTLRLVASWGMLLSMLVFAWSFLSLGRNVKG